MNAHTFFRRLMIVVLAMVFATIVITDYGNRVAQVGEFGGEASVGSWVAQYCCVDFCYIEGSFEEGCNRLDAPDCEAFIDGPPAADTTCRHTYCNNWYYYTDPTTNLAACNSFCNQFGSGGDSCDVGMTGGIGTIAGGSSAASSTPGGSSTASSGASSAGSSGSGGSSNGSSGSGGSSNGSSGSGGSSQASSGDSSSTSSVPITCGNNILQSGEVCDGTQGLYNCPSRACTGSCTCRPLSSSSRASSGGSSSADSQAPISSTASSAGSSQSLIPDPECPQGRAEVTVRSNLQNGINYIHALPSGRYKVEVISPQGIPDMDYVNNSWVNTASDTGLFHGSSVFIVRGADPIFGSDTDPVTRGEGGTRVTNAIVYLDSAKFGPPYNQNRRRAADAARGVSVLLNIQTSERLVFVVNDLVGGTKKSTYADNRGTVRIRLCAQTLFATSSSASVASSLASSASSSRASSVVSSSVVSVASAFSSARSSAASALSSAASVVSALSSSAFSASAGSSVSATSSVQALVALAPDCGNGAVEDGEFCDDGNTSNMDGCTNACRLSSCGDGIIQAPESCDEGVYNSDEFADTCRTGCVLPYCGDDIIDSDESCDDGNTWNDDGCSSDCRRNPPAPCSHNRECSSNLCFSGICMALNVCGNGLREDREWCDDGNQDPSDGCMPSCRWPDNMQCDDDDQCDSGYCLNGICAERPVCGDGVVQSGEGCDQGTANSNVIPNRCRLSCMLASLGDGVIDNGEECDDGNAIDGDGCDARGRSELVAGLIDTQAPVAPLWGASSSAVAYVLPTATLSPPLPVLATLMSVPVGAMANPNTGPAAVVLMASGAAAGFAWIRRKRS